jgi:hypothetical protein
MTMRFGHHVLLAAAMLVLLGCAGPQLHHGQLSALDKGISSTDAIARLKLTPLSIHSASAAGRAFEFHHYRLNNGLHSDTYLLAYERSQLVYWGYLSEFRRHTDRDLNAALDLALREMNRKP